MLDWIKRIATPPPAAPVVESENANPATDERLERLLVRVGNDTGHPTETATTETATSEIATTETGANAESVVGAEADPVDVATGNSTLGLDSSLGIDRSVATEELDIPEPDDTETNVAAEIDAIVSRIGGDAALMGGAVASVESETASAADDNESDNESGDDSAILGASVGARQDNSPIAAATSIVTARKPVAPVTAGVQQMKIIAVCSQKGGSGKTTIAGHLAVQAGLAGNGPAVLIDTDPQASLAEWWRARKDEAPALAKVRLEELGGNLDELRSYGTAVTIIDTPPALTASIEQVMAIADLVLIPARPSPHDLRAVGATVEICRRAGKPFLFVVNGAAQRANITVQAVAALSEHGRVSPVILYQRTEFAASMIDGRTVVETAPASRSAQEIAELWKFVHAQIGMRAAA